MTSKFESALLESGSIMRRGKSLLLDNMGKTIALITAALAVLLTFTDITLYEASALGVLRFGGNVDVACASELFSRILERKINYV